MSEDAATDRILSALEKLDTRLDALEKKVDGLAGAGAATGTAVSTGGALDAKLADAEVQAALTRILDRVEALEKVSGALATMVERAPILLDGGAETVEWVMAQAAERGVDPIARGERGLELLLQASHPSTMDLAEKLLDPEVTAGLGKLTDKGAAVLTSSAIDTLAESGLLDPEKLDATIGALDRLAAVTTTPEFQKLLDSGLLDPKVLGVAGDATTALVQVRSSAVEPVGLFGTLGKLGDPDVKKAMGFLFAIAKRFGATL